MIIMIITIIAIITIMMILMITFVPRTFLRVVAARRRVEWLKFSTFDTAIVGLCTLAIDIMMIVMLTVTMMIMIIIHYGPIMVKNHILETFHGADEL